MRIENVRIDDIKISDHIREDVGDLDGLIATIGKEGLIYPIIIDKDNYLIDGKRRLEALKLRGLEEVPAIRIEGDKDRLLLQLIANLQRKDLSPIEKAKAFKRFIEENNISIRKASALLGISKTSIEYHLKLLELPQEVKEKIEKGIVKPYSIEKLVYKHKVKTKEDFEKLSIEKQFTSIINRLSSLKTIIKSSSLTESMWLRVKKKIIEILNLVERKLAKG